MSRFSTVNQIKLNDEISLSKIYLTLDIDWACDKVVERCAEILVEHAVPATWFVTHDSPVLKELRSVKYFELGIHPNFNFLLNGDGRNGATAEEVVDRVLELVPEATSVRSHSMTQSSVLLELFSRKGLTHECNHFIPEQAGIELRPWKHWVDIIKVPYFWEDDVHCLSANNSSMHELVNRKGLKVFDFHPIHVFLNSESMARYEGTRDLHRIPEKLQLQQFEGQGTRSRLLELINVGNF